MRRQKTGNRFAKSGIRSTYLWAPTRAAIKTRLEAGRMKSDFGKPDFDELCFGRFERLSRFRFQSRVLPYH